MNFLISLINLANRAAGIETNFERVDASLAFMLQPSVDPNTGSATVNLGPPTGGTFVIGTLFVDAALAQWRCTVAGTPGTWIQQTAAVCSVDPAGPPNDYTIARTAEHLKKYYWNGAAWTAV